MSTKQTYQPKKRRRMRVRGFRARMETRTGRDVLKRRRQKGRHKLIVVELGGGKRINWKESAQRPRRGK